MPGDKNGGAARGFSRRDRNGGRAEFEKVRRMKRFTQQYIHARTYESTHVSNKQAPARTVKFHSAIATFRPMVTFCTNSSSSVHSIAMIFYILARKQRVTVELALYCSFVRGTSLRRCEFAGAFYHHYRNLPE